MCVSCYSREQTGCHCLHAPESENETFFPPGPGPTPAPPSGAVDPAFTNMASTISQMADLQNTMGKAVTAALGRESGNRSTLNAAHVLKPKKGSGVALEDLDRWLV